MPHLSRGISPSLSSSLGEVAFFLSLFCFLSHFVFVRCYNSRCKIHKTCTIEDFSCANIVQFHMKYFHLNVTHTLFSASKWANEMWTVYQHVQIVNVKTTCSRSIILKTTGNSSVCVCVLEVFFGICNRMLTAHARGSFRVRSLISI